MKSFSVVLVLVILSSLTTSQAAQNCSCVAFRLDDIQDYFISIPQRAILEVFYEYKIPLTIGVIANYFGDDPVHVNFIRSCIAKNAEWEVEVAAHGWNHEDFDLFTLSQQTVLLNDTNYKLQEVLSIPPLKTFIPPRNIFNNDTFVALQNLGYTHMSSQTSLDSYRPYELEGETIYRFPIGAATNDLLKSQFIGVSHQLTWSQIQEQLATDGFAVVMMHPQEFSAYNSVGGHTNSVNETMINELRMLLDMVVSSGLTPVPIGRINLDASNDRLSGFVSTGPVSTTAMSTGIGTSTGNGGSTTGSINPEFNCSCIAFKLDQIQDFYYSPINIAIMGAFKDVDVPLTVGVIPKKLKTDQTMINYLKTAYTDNYIRYAVHGYDYEDFSAIHSFEAQRSLMMQANTEFNGVLNVIPRVFSPPWNRLNVNTTRAAENVGYQYFSAIAANDKGPYLDPSMFRFPAGSTTWDPADVVKEVPWPVTAIFDQVKQQLQADGFGVIAMSPKEFGLGWSSQDVNTTQIAELKKLFRMIQDSGLSIVYIEDISHAGGITGTTGPRRPPAEESSSVQLLYSKIFLTIVAIFIYLL